MADLKISELPAATALTDTDVLPLTQGTATNKAAVSLLDGRYAPRASRATFAATSIRTSGDIALAVTSSTWADVDPALNLVVSAAAGDRILLDPYVVPATSTGQLAMNAWTAANLIPAGWAILANSALHASGAVLHTVAASDVVGGVVTFRLRVFPFFTGTKTFYANGNVQMRWTAVNLG